ncbi:hypothetical protein O9K51_02106 [Purpureocillium lavendulum]|uniref:Zn(2)-C6 fungal-type domain-containing protein n=1 Tax=Purpureocillium lavendulum TaxID=1247861 RepID=A0AB34FYK3_9HYPO|nr:hypothetical protein O9K51_02106 [Purpureocillium lavendulum]
MGRPHSSGDHPKDKETASITVSSNKSPQQQQQQQQHQQSRLRNSCDRCQDTKLRCTQTKPACWRCVRMGLPCVYSPIRRLGRPRKVPNQQSSTTSSSADTLPAQQGPPQEQPQQDEPQVLTSQPPGSSPLSGALHAWGGGGGASGGGSGDTNNENSSTTERTDEGVLAAPSSLVSSSSVATTLVEGIPVSTALPGTIRLNEDGGGNGTVAPSSLEQPVIDPELTTTSFDAVLDDPEAFELLFATSWAETSPFRDFLPLGQTPDSSVDQAVQAVTDPGPSVTLRAGGGLTDSHGRGLSAFPSGAGNGSTATDLPLPPQHAHPKSPHLPATLPVASISSCDSRVSECYRCLCEQLQELNNCMNDDEEPSLDTTLQLERNMQLLSQRLLQCPTCLANPNSLLLLSIVVDQVIRLHQRQSTSFGGIGLASPHHGSSPVQITDLRIGDYEVHDDDFKLTFLKRLVRHRLRTLARLLTDLQQTTTGHMNDVQCNATLQMVRAVIKRVERLQGKIALKW